MKILFDYRVIQNLENKSVQNELITIAKSLYAHGSMEVFFLVSKKFSISQEILPHHACIEVEELNNYPSEKIFDFFFSPLYFYFEPLITATSSICETIIPDIIFKICNQCAGILSSLSSHTHHNGLTEEQKNLLFELEFNNLCRINHFFYFSEFTKQKATALLHKSEKQFYPFTKEQSEAAFQKKCCSKNAIAIYSNPYNDETFEKIIQNALTLYSDKSIPPDSLIYLYNISEQQKNILFQYLLTNSEIKINFILYDDVFEKLVNAVTSCIYLTEEDYAVFSLQYYLKNNIPCYTLKNSTLSEFVDTSYCVDENAPHIYSHVLTESFANEIHENTKFWSISNAAISRDIYLKLSELQQKYKKRSKIAVFAPEKGAVAEFAAKIFSAKLTAFDFIADFSMLSNYEHMKSCSNVSVPNIFPFSCLPELLQSREYSAKIFLFGDSPFHKQVFHEALRTKGEKNRFALFAEPFIYHMITSYFAERIMVSSLRDINAYYPEKAHLFSGIDENAFFLPLVKNSIGFLRLLYDQTGIDNFIFYGKLARTFAENDLKGLPINFYEIPVPLERVVCSKKIDFKTNSYVIGSFGIPSAFKQTNLVYDAVQILNEQGYDIKLLLAGFGTADYVKNNKFDTSNLIIYDSPNKTIWLSLLNSVDLAIQLRPYTIAVNSGCMAELGNLGKKMIVTQGACYDIFAPLCKFVGKDVTKEELAQTILSFMQDNQLIEIPDEEFEKLKYETVAQQIIDIVNCR